MKYTVKSVTQAECANYFREGPWAKANWCVSKEQACHMFASFKRCRYFETAVLPAWQDVAAEYAAMCGQMEIGEETVARIAVCRNCGESFRAESNSIRYCSEACKIAAAKRVQREKKRRQRAEVG